MCTGRNRDKQGTVRYLEPKSNKNMYFLKPSVCPRNLCFKSQESIRLPNKYWLSTIWGLEGPRRSGAFGPYTPWMQRQDSTTSFSLAFAKVSATSHTPPPRARS